MATFYQGYRNVLKGRSEARNTYTGKLGVYSNWELMNPSHVLDGAPDHNRVPGSGPYGEGDVTMSRWFLGLDVPFKKSSLVSPGIKHPDIYSGRYPVYQWFGVPSAQSFRVGFGHLPLAGPMAEYAEWSNYIYVGLPIGKALPTATLGHVERFPNYTSASTLGPFNSNPGRSSSFGAFEPYINKGVYDKKSAPLALHTGHIEYGPSVVADLMPSDYGRIPPPRTTVVHYGFEHVMEWFGVPSAEALAM